MKLEIEGKCTTVRVTNTSTKTIEKVEGRIQVRNEDGYLLTFTGPSSIVNGFKPDDVVTVSISTPQTSLKEMV